MRRAPTCGTSFDLDDSDAPPRARRRSRARRTRTNPRARTTRGSVPVGVGATVVSRARATRFERRRRRRARSVRRFCWRRTWPRGGRRGGAAGRATWSPAPSRRSRRGADPEIVVGDHPGDDDDGESEGDDTYGVSPLRLRRHLAAVGGCLVTRAAARRAFEKRKLATLAGTSSRSRARDGGGVARRRRRRGRGRGDEDVRRDGGFFGREARRTLSRRRLSSDVFSSNPSSSRRLVT